MTAQPRADLLVTAERRAEELRHGASTDQRRADAELLSQLAQAVRDLRASHGILDHVVAAIGRVLCGEPVSDFDKSYAEVRGVVDLQAHLEAQRVALREYGQHKRDCQLTTFVVPVDVACPKCGEEHQSYMGNRISCAHCGARWTASATPVCTCGLDALILQSTPQETEDK